MFLFLSNLPSSVRGLSAVSLGFEAGECRLRQSYWHSESGADDAGKCSLRVSSLLCFLANGSGKNNDNEWKALHTFGERLNSPYAGSLASDSMNISSLILRHEGRHAAERK